MNNEQDLFRQFLDDISTAFLEKRVHRWRNRLILPFSIIMRDGPVVMSSDQAVKENFDHYLTACSVLKIDMIDRHQISLEDCDDGTWLGTFQTRLVSEQTLAAPAYTSTVLLQIQDGSFRMSSMLNGRGHSDWTGVMGI